MHILTKVFVLFAAVLSLLLAALTIPYALNAERIASANEQLRTQVTAMKAARAQEAAAEDEEIGRLRLEAQSIADENQKLGDNVTRLERELAQVQRDRRQAEASRDAVAGQVDQINETLQTQTDLLASYSSEVSELRDNELRFRREKLDLEDTVADLDSQVEVLTQANRALQEQLVEARNSIAQGGTQGAGGVMTVASGEPFELSGPPVVGTVQQIRVDPSTGRTLARVSVGSNDRIQKDMKMYLARGGDQFIGNLVIIDVDLNWAVGVVDTLGTGSSVQRGDLALSSLQ